MSLAGPSDTGEWGVLAPAELIRSPSWFSVVLAHLVPVAASVGQPTTSGSCPVNLQAHRESTRRPDKNTTEKAGQKTQPRRPEQKHNREGRTKTQPRRPDKNTTEKAGQKHNSRPGQARAAVSCIPFRGLGRPAGRPKTSSASACYHCRQNEPVVLCELMALFRGRNPLARIIVAGRPGELGPILASAQRLLLAPTATWAGAG